MNALLIIMALSSSVTVSTTPLPTMDSCQIIASQFEEQSKKDLDRSYAKLFVKCYEVKR